MKNLALAYHIGIGVEKDLNQFIEWLSKAIEESNVKDADWIVELVIGHKERNQEEDAERCSFWLEKAESLGNIRAFILQALYRAKQLETLEQSAFDQLVNSLLILSWKVEEIKHRHLFKDNSKEIIAHFTTLEALHSMLPVNNDLGASDTRVLRLYNIAYMNDPQEGRRLLNLDHQNSKLLREFFSATELVNNYSFLWENQEFSVYCGSFTLSVDRLDLWRAYGRDGLGYCLVTPAKTFQQEQELSRPHFMHEAIRREYENPMEVKAHHRKDPELYLIHYEEGQAIDSLDVLKENLEALQNIKEENTQLSELINSLVRTVVSDILYLYKNEEYASEKEARMIVVHNITDKTLKLDDRQPPRVYVETDAFLFRDVGTRIIIGPKVADKVAAELNLKYRLARQGLLETTVVEFSKVKYR